MQHDEPTPWQDVPAALVPALRPQLAATADEIIAAVRREVPEYDQPLEGEFGHLITEGVRVALDQFVDLLGTDERQPVTGIYAAMGRAELDAGRTLDALQSAYRTGARVAWRRVVADLGGTLEPPAMYALAEAIFAYIDRLADASVAGYTDALAAREGSVQARRQALVELVVGGPATADVLARAAADAAWAVPSVVAVVAVAHDDPVALARRAPEGTVAGRTEDGGALLVPDPDGPGRAALLGAALAEVAAAVGPAVALPRAHVSAARAARALALVRSGALPPRGAVRCDDHRVALLLAADPDLVAEVAEARLGALRRLTPNARTRAEATLRAWLDAHGDVSVAAEALHVHPQTVRYRLGTLRDLLGAGALDDPGARLELALAMAAQPQLSGGSGAPARRVAR